MTLPHVTIRLRGYGPASLQDLHSLQPIHFAGGPWNVVHCVFDKRVTYDDPESCFAMCEGRLPELTEGEP